MLPILLAALNVTIFYDYCHRLFKKMQLSYSCREEHFYYIIYDRESARMLKGEELSDGENGY